MKRLPDDQKLSFRFLVNCNRLQYDMVQTEAEARGVAPTIIAREAFARGLESLRTNGKPATPGRPANREENPEQRTRRPRKTTRVLKKEQIEHDALCLPHLQEATGLKDAARRLEAAGVLTPTGKTRWNTVSIWRICQRHGLSYSDAGDGAGSS